MIHRDKEEGNTELIKKKKKKKKDPAFLISPKRPANFKPPPITCVLFLTEQYLNEIGMRRLLQHKSEAEIVTRKQMIHGRQLAAPISRLVWTFSEPRHN